ncbi:tetratricopeptide repeat protein [Candidatus Sumerlaeota bacterium]|nr:tetratricopeptide repeat protein [Candidatus Sumerlaeota bacterium]
MPELPNKKRSPLLNPLLILNSIVTVFLAAVLRVRYWSELSQFPLLGWFDLVEDFFSLETGGSARIGGLQALHSVLYVAAYFAGFDFRASARPVRRLLLLHAQTGLILSIWTIHLFEIPFGIAGVLLVVSFTCLWPALAWWSERGIGRVLPTVVNFLVIHELPWLSNLLLRAAIYLCPDRRSLRMDLGIALYDARDEKGSIAVLEDLLEHDTNDVQLLEILQACYRNNEDWEKALEMAKRQMEIDPADSGVRMRTARALDHLGRCDEAIAVLREGLPCRKFDYLNQLLDLLLKTRDLPGALAIVRDIEKLESPPQARAREGYKRILQADTHLAPALEGLGSLLIRQDEKADGFAFFEELLKIESQREDLRIRLVGYYQESSQIARAEPHLQALMDAGHETKDVMLLYGDSLVQREDYDQALLHLHYAVEVYPDDYRFAYFLAQISFKTLALEEAVRWCEEASRKVGTHEERQRVQALRRRIEDSMMHRELEVLQDRCNRAPEDTQMRVNLILGMASHGMTEKAVLECENLLKSKPHVRGKIIRELERFLQESDQNFRLVDYLADLKVQDERWDEAFELGERLAARSMHGDDVMAEHCERILRKRPTHVPSLRRLGEILMRRKDWTRVLQIFGQIRELTHERDTATLKGIFQACMELNDTENGMKVGEAILEDEPHAIDVRLDLIRLLREDRRYDEAMDHLHKAQSTDFYNAEVVRLLREVSTERRTHRLEQLVEIMEENPQDAGAQLEAGALYLEIGEPKKAISCFQKASTSPDTQNIAKAHLALAMARLRMFDLAEETLDEATLDVKDPREQNNLKILFFDVAQTFENEDDRKRALKFYKKIFRIDAEFRRVVDKVESLGT